MDRLSFLEGLDIKVLETYYQNYKADSTSVDDGWRIFFDGFDLALSKYSDVNTPRNNKYPDEFKLINLINAYRERGHFFTLTNPVRSRRKFSPTLDIENFGFKQEDLNQSFEAGHEIGIGKASLSTIVDFLQETYCRSIGVEYMYIRNPEIVEWLKGKMEPIRNNPSFDEAHKKQMLGMIVKGVYFEQFIRMKFPGQKSFSLEGAETLIPALNALIEKGAASGIGDFVIGMAHRGRLNVLANILHKPYRNIFNEFAGKTFEDETGSFLGDVKYHMGSTLEFKTDAGHQVNLSIAPNPSHLEAVYPVVEGLSRAKADLKYQGDNSKIAPVIIHGDASIAGQGVVYETVQMAGLEAYNTGGSIHFVINNQVGFTTNYQDARSGIYSTDVAKVLQSPIFHVNGDDLEAVVYVTNLALEFRQRFKRDVFIDLLCYRKFGHNESDEPRFTQPLLYKVIEKHPDPASLYISKLIAESIISPEYADVLKKGFLITLEDEYQASLKIEKGRIDQFLKNTWKDFKKPSDELIFDKENTIYNKDALLRLAKLITTLPEDKTFFRKTVRLMQDRKDMVFEKGVVDWAMAELLAYATLLDEGFHVRISGQDVERGTFSHRHAVLKVEDSEEEYVPLKYISKQKPGFEIYNSHLSEYAVTGFEYGYAMASPNTLSIWEAQFGDFVNGAQIVVDQFISSAEEKWKVMNGLVMLLPHGFEGQGPEHSSARIERFLSLCAANNIQVVNCSTPANFFHVLRRQMHRSWRKPLIIFTPKSLLRHPDCISSADDLAMGSFYEVIDDHEARPETIERVLLCSGKIFYELEAEKKRRGDGKTAVIRVEQLYPFPAQGVEALRFKYINTAKWIWVQEEPQNMGAWPYIQYWNKALPLGVISRPPSGSPASGSGNFHKMQQQKIIEKSFETCNCVDVCRECKQLCISHLIDQ